MKCKTAWAKTAFNKKRILFTRKLRLNLWNKAVKCYTWNIALCGAETGTFRDVD
jgi:hypothetical protein